VPASQIFSAELNNQRDGNDTGYIELSDARVPSFFLFVICACRLYCYAMTPLWPACKLFRLIMEKGVELVCCDYCS
jgi:hypothetical protein